MAATTDHQRNTSRAIALSAGEWDIELFSAGSYEVRYVAQQNAIGVALDPQMGVHAIGTDRRQSFSAKVGAIGVISAGCDIYSSARHGGEYLRLVARGTWPLDIVHRQSEGMSVLAPANAMRRAILVGADTLTCEFLALNIVERLSLGTSGQAASAKTWITPRRLRQVEDLIEEGLEGGILVSNLAQCLGLSTPFFSRAFREATGRSPQEHIIRRRLQRAINLVRETQSSLAAIAAECGFASHAHMSNLFRTRLGVSPGELQRLVANTGPNNVQHITSRWPSA